MRELLLTLGEHNLGIWDTSDVDTILARWSDSSAIDFDEFVSDLFKTCNIPKLLLLLLLHLLHVCHQHEQDSLDPPQRLQPGLRVHADIQGWVYQDCALISPPDSSEECHHNPRHLTINFDVQLVCSAAYFEKTRYITHSPVTLDHEIGRPRNKTLVMRDKTAGKSVEVVINEACAICQEWTLPSATCRR